MIDKNMFKGSLGWSLVSLIFICLFSIYSIATSFSPFFTQRIGELSTAQTNSLLEKHESLVAVDIARFNGRSVFFKPIRKPKPRPKEPVKAKDDVIKDPIKQGPPPPPVDYRGPRLIAIIGDEAWFRGTGTGANAVIKLKIGEDLNGLKLISTALPSIATVEHLLGIYEIDLFDSEELFFLQDPPPAVSHDFLEEAEG